jgi:inosose dehydratase
MEYSRRHTAAAVARPWAERLAGAPISWGACEVPGWGLMPAPERVLAEMASLGLRGTELGAPGFLPAAPGQVRALLARHGLQLVGGFCPLVLHEVRFDTRAARTALGLLAAAGGELLVLAVVRDLQWSAPGDLDDAGWRHLARHVDQLQALAGEYGVTVALHPHAGTLIETAEQIGRALQELTVGWCLDTGHLVIGGVDPAQFARDHGDRVVHVHLKDVDAPLAGRLRARELSLLGATQRGLFRPLGRGGARIESVLDALTDHGYDGWLVLEQDTAITADEPTVQGGPIRDARESIAFLADSAPSTQEVHR